jgi:hypothetical protein
MNKLFFFCLLLVACNSPVPHTEIKREAPMGNKKEELMQAVSDSVREV